jgi:hypothetical protein
VAQVVHFCCFPGLADFVELFALRLSFALSEVISAALTTQTALALVQLGLRLHEGSTALRTIPEFGLGFLGDLRLGLLIHQSTAQSLELVIDARLWRVWG